MGTVLTVDDSEPVRKLVGMVLRNAGYTVTTACNGAEAMLRMQEQRFDLIVTDINMPVMSGAQLIEQVQQTHPELPILVLTTEDQQRQNRSGNVSGASGWVLKPFQPTQFTDLVHRLLHRANLA